jgi:dihydrofolate synthase / folylpolyglutamate synthase
MNIKVVKTKKITNKDIGLTNFIDKYIKELSEKSIVVLTSKVVAILEGNYLAKDVMDKEKLVFRESDYYAFVDSKYGFRLTINNNMLIPSAGIDESNSFGYYVLLPKNSYKSAKIIWKYLKNKFNLKYVGVIITDSKTTPLRWGTTGISTGYCGFCGLNDYIGKKDIFDREMKVTKSNIVDGLAAGAVVEMGEGKEQTPLAIITEAKQVRFKKTATSQQEIDDFKIALEDDLYYPILSRVDWIKGDK